MRQIKIDGRLPEKKRNTLGIILFVPALIIFGLLFKQLADWRTDIRSGQEQAELDKFVGYIYEPLLKSQEGIKLEQRKMQRILRDMELMGREHPNHEQLIANIVNRWYVGLQDLWVAYSKTNREIKYYWLLSRTNEGQDIKSKFSKRAIGLKTNNDKAVKKYQKIIYLIRDDLIESLDVARALLDSNRKPARKKKKREMNQFIRENIQPFNDATTAKLVEFVGRVDERLKVEVEKLQELIRKSGQQSVIIRNYLQNNPDLEAPLTITINNWVILENQSRDKLNQILYAIEAEYVAINLDLPLQDAAIRSMHRSLLKDVPLIVGKALKQKKNIDQSYNITPRSDR